MSSLQQITTRVIESDSKHWQRQIFRSDDDLTIPVSIWLESNEGETDLISDIISLLQAYGFAVLEPITKAPGSSFISFRGKSINSSEETIKNKERLKSDLLGKTLPHATAKRKTVSKVKKGLAKRIRKKLGAVALIGTLFMGAGTIAGHIIKGAGEEFGSYVVKNLSKILQS